jgi:hypothetical protein
MEERPPAMEGSCEYIEKAAEDKQQGETFLNRQLGMKVYTKLVKIIELG